MMYKTTSLSLSPISVFCYEKYAVSCHNAPVNVSINYFSKINLVYQFVYMVMKWPSLLTFLFLAGWSLDVHLLAMVSDLPSQSEDKFTISFPNITDILCLAGLHCAILAGTFPFLINISRFYPSAILYFRIIYVFLFSSCPHFGWLWIMIVKRVYFAMHLSSFGFRFCHAQIFQVFL